MSINLSGNKEIKCTLHKERLVGAFNSVEATKETKS